MNKEEVIKICNSLDRLPLSIRTDKEKAINFLNIIKENNIDIKNSYILPLAEWCGCDLFNYNKDEKYSKVLSIEFIGNEQTYDLQVNDGSSYKANGIIAHNTTNLPADTTVDMVDQIYRKAWEVGCKGITIYRDGSRSGVLVSADKKDEKKKEKEKENDIIKENNAPKRPKSLDCEVIRFMNKGEKWIGFVGLLDKMPYEIFTGLAESFIIPKYVENGKITKIKGGDKDGGNRYDFVYVDKDGYEMSIPALNRAFNPEYWNIAKMVSAVLRHGMPLPSAISLIDSLKIDGDFIGTWKAGIKRMLKSYIKDGVELSKENLCPTCGSNSLIFQDGCVSCTSCGWSKCS